MSSGVRQPVTHSKIRYKKAEDAMRKMGASKDGISWMPKAGKATAKPMHKAGFKMVSARLTRKLVTLMSL